MDSKQSLYFGYGSNLWLHQMELRCPDSTYMGIGMLPGWRLQINQRGYCNVVQIRASSTATVSTDQVAETPTDQVVYGLVYLLSSEDEDKLDVNEGVPHAYKKEIIRVHFWPYTGAHPVDVNAQPEQRDMLVYVDRFRTNDSKPRKEYIYRMNMGAADALKMGIPNDYIQEVIRKYIPAEHPTDEEDRQEAQQQAMRFEDK